MLKIEMIPQPAIGTNAGPIQIALQDARHRTVRAAFAYVTSSGVNALSDALRVSTSERRWLTSIDWCRSEPTALTALDKGARSAVRVHAGSDVVAQSGCTPSKSFHPKLMLLSGESRHVLISGSGNLSRNGLETGVEFDTVITVENPQTPDETAVWEQLEDVARWFDEGWSQATPWEQLTSAYGERYRYRPQVEPTMQIMRSTSGSAFSIDQLNRIAMAETFWVETGNLRSHQLNLKALCRVFFGFDSSTVQRKTGLGVVTIRFGGNKFPAQSIEYAHNGMDRINLPATFAGGPVDYSGQTLAFRKQADDNAIVFQLEQLNGPVANQLRRRSLKMGLSFEMRYGRRFGFC